MIPILLLVTTGALLRTFGAMLRPATQPLWLRLGGWMICAVGVWLLAGALGAWFPIWPILLIGLIAGILSSWWPRREVAIGADAVVVLASGLWSIPPLEFPILAAGVIALPVLGWLIDHVNARSGIVLRHYWLTVPASVAVLLLVLDAIVQPVPTVYAWHRTHPLALLSIGVSHSAPGQRIELECGAVAWLARPRGEGPFPGAIIFHGDHPAGSQQPAASALRRALLQANHVVLAVDQVGYGQSRTPLEHADIAEWDHLPAALEATQLLRNDPGVDRVYAFGHSMGVSVVLRLLAAEHDLAGAILLGGSLSFPHVTEEYRVSRFHQRRNLSYQMPHTRIIDILDRYHHPDRLAEELLDDHPAVRFVAFEHEHDDIKELRNGLYGSIPGDKAWWTLKNMTHYFNVYAVPTGHDLGVLIGDVSTTRRFADDINRVVYTHMPMEQPSKPERFDD